MWKKFKTFIRKIIGQKNTDRLTLMSRFLSIRFNRTSRFLFQSRKEIDSVQLKSYSVEGFNTFFGYYDISPFDYIDKRLLAVAAPRSFHTPKSNQPLQVGYFNLNEPDIFHSVGISTTWCWQQSCRLRWFPNENENLVLYNTMVDGKYGAVVQNIESKTEKIIPFPLYDIDVNGNWGLTLNFSRLQRLRPGYGYSNIPDYTKNDKFPESDGISLIDLSTNQSKLILSLKFLACYQPKDTMEDAEHYINHICFNPTGNLFMFFHLWIKGGQHYNRLIVSDKDGSNLRVLLDEGQISHYTWKSETELVVTVNYNRNPSRYYLVDVNSGNCTWIYKILTKDGHPSYYNKSQYFLTDTYPDKFGEQILLVITPQNETKVIDSYFLPFKFRGEVRCDLHPRWAHKNKFICFDSAHKGIRKLFVADVKAILSKEFNNE